MSGPGSSSLQTQSSVAHAALLNSLNKDLSETRFLKSELRGRQRRAALVGEAYIVAPSSNCQHAFPSFLNFLRQTKNPQQTIQQNPAERPEIQPKSREPGGFPRSAIRFQEPRRAHAIHGEPAGNRIV